MNKAERDEVFAELREILGEFTQELHRNVRTLMSVREQGAHRVTFPSLTAATTHQQGQRPTTAPNRLLGWSIRETTGLAPATVIFRDGHDIAGDEIASVNLAPGESDRYAFPAGISLIDGLYIDCTSGAVAGAVYLGST
jgi:hypothetical protein